MLALQILGIIVSPVYYIYIFAGLISTMPIEPRIRRFNRDLANEVQPFYLPAITIMWADSFEEAVVRGSWMHRFFYAVGFTGAIIMYFLYRDDDDDRWRKRRKKLTEKITRVGSRLVVSPQGTA